MKIIMKWLGFAVLFLSSIAYADKISSYKTIPLEDLKLNRTAQKLSVFQKKRFSGAHTGFIWNAGDNKTTKWRPQGIAGIATLTKKFLVVSWYGRKEAGYTNHGARVSIVDVTSMDSIKYRHILLVDQSGRMFEGMHAGGLVYRHGKLHVPDSRNGNKKIHVFSMDSIREIPTHNKMEFYNYRYLLKKESSYEVPITPSFLSYDWDREQVLVGTFFKCDNRFHKDTLTCMGNKANRLAWFSIGSVNEKSTHCTPFFSEMQGAASNADVLWVSSSFGQKYRSHLHISAVEGESCDAKRPKLNNWRVVSYPPGLEDIHVSLTSDNIWMLTEFGPSEGIGNNRVVFATKKGKLMP